MSMLIAQALTPVPTSLVTNSVFIAVTALLHTEIATFITGATMIGVVSEAISMVRADERHERLAHGLLTSMIYVFGFGSALAIFWVIVLFVGLWGRFFVSLSQITFWVFVFEAGTFLVEIVLIYTLYAGWDRLRRYRPARLAIYVLLAVALWWQMFFIDVVGSYMMTPNGGEHSVLRQIFNPTALPLTLHRTVGNMAWAGAVIAFVAAVRYLRVTARERRRAAVRLAPARSVGAMSAAEHASPSGDLPPADQHDEASYWDFLGQWGVCWAVGMTLFQPWIGYSYAKEIQLHGFPAWYRMMLGDLSNVFIVQIVLLGLIFLLGALYFRSRMRALGLRARTQSVVIAVLVAALLVAAVPHHLAWSYDDVVNSHRDHPLWEGGLVIPFGSFIPWKVFALLAFLLAGLWSLTSFLRARTEAADPAPPPTRRSQRLLVGLGVTLAAMMLVMGFIREHSRQPYLISGELRIEHQQPVGGLGPPSGP